MASTKNILISDRYAEALVKIAKDGKLTFEKISMDLNLVKDTLTKSKDLYEVLINPIVSIEDKKEIIDRVFLNEIDGLIINFLKVLVDKNRFDAFDEILTSYNKAIDDVNNISRIEVISAVKMSEESKTRLKNKLEEKMRANVIFDLHVNPDIIAGLVIKIGDNVIDMSLKHKLEDLSKNITR